MGKEGRKEKGILKDPRRHSRERETDRQSSLYGQLKSHSRAKIKKAKRHRHAVSQSARTEDQVFRQEYRI